MSGGVASRIESSERWIPSQARRLVSGTSGTALHQEAAGHCNVDGMGSIRGSQLEQNILHVRLYRCLRNGKVRSDYLVRGTASYFSENLNFALTEIIFRVVFSEFSRDFLRYIPSSEVNCSDSLQQ